MLERKAHKKILDGQQIILARPENDTTATQIAALTHCGAEVFHQPAIQIVPSDLTAEIISKLDTFDQYDWILFSSENGVLAFFDLVQYWGDNSFFELLSSVCVGAVGPNTAIALQRLGVAVHLIADVHRAEGLAEGVVNLCFGSELVPKSGKSFRILAIRSNKGRNVLQTMLEESALDCSVEELVTYENIDVTTPCKKILSLLNQAKELPKEERPWVLVTSGSVAYSLSNLWGDAILGARLVAISPLTATTLRELGAPAELIASTHSVDGMVATICERIRD